MTLNWIKALKQIRIQRVYLLLVFALSFTTIYAQEDNIDIELVKKGKELFKSNGCAACHNATKDMTGPKLEGVTQKWEEAVGADFKGKSGKQWLYEWIRNYNVPVEAELPIALEVLNFSPANMQLTMGISDEDIEAILYYSDHSTAGLPKAVAETTATEEDTSSYANWLLGILVAILLFAIFALSRLEKSLGSVAAAKSGVVETESTPFFKSGLFKTLVTVLFLIGFFYLLGSQAIALGRQQGYQPMQPIKYSHALHAGEYEIDCKYCHTGATEGKHSNIPSPNMCMNCHKLIQSGPKHGRKEIAKIYAAIGFNPEKGTYFDLENVTEEEYTEAFKSFLAKDEKNENVTAATEKEVEEILAMFNKPIEWVRIHNLPDHVYFNHAQHVEVGKVECQTCHGDVQDMEVVEQHAPLSMGWCINCHRNTEIDLSNPYYDDNKLIQEMEAAHKKVTVEDIGGTDCQKCHY